MSFSNRHPEATVEEGWESSDQLLETTNEGAESSNQLGETQSDDWESSDQLAETTDEGAESSDQLAETQSDDFESSSKLSETQNDDSESYNQLSETPDEDLEPTTAPPKYSSVQTIADIETGSSYELQENMVQRLRETDLESGRVELTKPRGNWTHKVGRMFTLENICIGIMKVVGGAFVLSFVFIIGILMWDLIVYVINKRQRIND
ncbi:hypothetical protein VE03_09416 [Pseudogymnoascus sp. 23342-1-I1]|nr:hypothetical protein VE03_09416 [Pseudogymnoascus sp. 23342-1-I1]